jgi:hypothetical protein
LSIKVLPLLVCCREKSGRRDHATGGSIAQIFAECATDEFVSGLNKSRLFPDVQLHIVDAPLGAGPGSILRIVVMDFRARDFVACPNDGELPG